VSTLPSFFPDVMCCEESALTPVRRDIATGVQPYRVHDWSSRRRCRALTTRMAEKGGLNRALPAWSDFLGVIGEGQASAQPPLHLCGVLAATTGRISEASMPLLADVEANPQR
jgi:hypothetical protein